MTTAIITLDERTEIPELREFLQHIHSVLNMQSAGSYQAGQDAYQSWANDISDDTAFRGNSITPILSSRRGNNDWRGAALWHTVFQVAWR